MIELSCVPQKMNTSIIKPILKDPKKPTDDINNIRPLSISNCLAPILENRIFQKMPSHQFGFKKTSCNHAIFFLKESHQVIL